MLKCSKLIEVTCKATSKQSHKRSQRRVMKEENKRRIKTEQNQTVDRNAGKRMRESCAREYRKWRNETKKESKSSKRPENNNVCICVTYISEKKFENSNDSFAKRNQLSISFVNHHADCIEDGKPTSKSHT